MKDYRDIILRPVITEKSMKLKADDNKVTFKVAPTANKIEVRNAVEKLFNVKVTNVNILNTADKKKRVGRQTGVVRGFKKAVVTLAEGSSINLFGEE
nr:50S ribosomal protein L23 [Faecalibaculum rodentium]